MSRRDIVRATFEEFALTSGLSRKSRSWYRRTHETIVVLTLLRLPYGRQYSLAVGVVLRALDADENPKEKDCQLRSRFDRLVPPTIEHRLNDLVDLQFPVADADRRDELLGLLHTHLFPLIEVAATLDGLRSGPGRELVRRSTVTDSTALDLLMVASGD
jgi:Domain of unknown function (DUF4304)